MILGTASVLVTTSPLVSPAAAESASEDVSSRPDAVSAMVAARVQDHRVEDESARTPTTATFANPNGTWTLESFAGVVRSKGNDDVWVPIDTTVEDQGPSFEAKATPVDVDYSDGGNKTVGTANVGEGSSVEVGWPTKLPTPQADGNELTYAGAVAGGDLVVDSFADGFRYSIVLDSAPEEGAQPLEFRIPLKFDGMQANAKEDGSIVLRDGGQRVGVMTPPVMWDQANESEEGKRLAVSSEIEGDGEARTLVLKPDMEFLQDPETTYPVTVDPQFSFSAAGDTFVESTSANGFPNSAELRVGSTSLGITQARSYLAFDLSSLSGVVGSASNAELQLSNFVTGSCSGSAVRASRVTAAFSIATIKWSNKPASTATGSTTTTASSGSTSCPAETVVEWDATQIVNDARTAGATLLGVEIKADSSTATSGYRKYRSLENGDPNKAPKLVVTFNKTPNAATGLTVAPGNPGYATSLTPTLSAVVSDPDGGLTRGYFEVKSGSTVVWSGSSGWATSGAQVSVTVPAGQLTNGSTYTVHAYSEDDLIKSSAAATSTIKVDTTAPTVTISSTHYTNNTWTSTVPVGNTFTYTGSADTASFDTVTDGVQKNVLPFPGTSYITFPFAPPAYWNTLFVTATDKAGNRGSTANFNFGSGQPGFSTPYPNTRATSTVPLNASAPPNSTGATVQWKFKSGGSWNTASHVTKAGSAWTGTVDPATGHSTTGDLVWDATSETYGTSSTLTAPAVVSVQTCFHYTTGGDKCAYPVTVQLVPSAFGGNFPVTEIGPASVALHTGEASVDGSDAVDSKAGLGRSFKSYDASAVTGGVFGPGWSNPQVLTVSEDTKATVVDNRTKDGFMVIVDGDSGSQMFVSDSGSTANYVPLVPTGDGTRLTFSAADELELHRPIGATAVVTKWRLVTPSGGGTPAWTFSSVTTPGDSANVSVSSINQHPVFVRESDPSVSGACTAAVQTVGCRGLAIAYNGSGASARVASVTRVIGAAVQSNVLVKTLAAYTYDGTGRLESVCVPPPASGKPSLCTTYGYTTVLGRTLLSEQASAGLKKWRFEYDGAGRLIGVKREQPGGGDAVWSVDYSLTPTSTGTPDLSAATAAQWGQTAVPTGVVALYRPHAGPAGVNRAKLFYTLDDGTLTNVAEAGPLGWLVETNWYNEAGRVVRHLDAHGWIRVQSAAAPERPRIAVESSSFTNYNAWGDAQTVGTRVVAQYGPARTATRSDGSIGLLRPYAGSTYDDDPNVEAALIASRPDSVGRGLLVKEVTGTSSADRTEIYDPRVKKFNYAPIVAGDGDGWALGRATSVATEVSPGSWSTERTRYDGAGREVEARQPGGSATGSGVGNDAQTYTTSYYSAAGSGDCGGKPQWDGLVCKVGPAAQPVGAPIPMKYYAEYDEYLEPRKVEELSAGDVVRTTTHVIDGLGRKISTTETTHAPGATAGTATTSYGYDDYTGLPSSSSRGLLQTQREFDQWGRVSSYTDSLGTVSTYAYDTHGRVSAVDDGQNEHGYGYDDVGRVLSASVEGFGTFSYNYTQAGDLQRVTYPNGVAADRSYDETGLLTGVTYSQASLELMTFRATSDAQGRTTRQSSPASQQQFVQDGLDRLYEVRDSRTTGCTSRQYGYDASSNRVSLTTFDPVPVSRLCQTAASASVETVNYDAAGRRQTIGHGYDDLGRGVTVPEADLGLEAAGDAELSYNPDDMVASIVLDQVDGSAGVATVRTEYNADPDGRVASTVTTADAVETERTRTRYEDATDEPLATETSTNGGLSWQSTKFVSVPGLGMAGSISDTSEVQLTNLRGDLVVTMPASAGGTTLLSFSESDEFGKRIEGNARDYGWLGTYQRLRDKTGNFVHMGARLYNPRSGAFTTPDKVRGGNLTAYSYPSDPINQIDTTGLAAQYGYGRWGQTHVNESKASSWKTMCCFGSKMPLKTQIRMKQKWFVRTRPYFTANFSRYLGDHIERWEELWLQSQTCYGGKIKKGFVNINMEKCTTNPWEHTETSPKKSGHYPAGR